MPETMPDQLGGRLAVLLDATGAPPSVPADPSAIVAAGRRRRRHRRTAGASLALAVVTVVAVSMVTSGPVLPTIEPWAPPPSESPPAEPSPARTPPAPTSPAQSAPELAGMDDEMWPIEIIYNLGGGDKLLWRFAGTSWDDWVSAGATTSDGVHPDDDGWTVLARQQIAVSGEQRIPNGWIRPDWRSASLDNAVVVPLERIDVSATGVTDLLGLLGLTADEVVAVAAPWLASCVGPLDGCDLPAEPAGQRGARAIVHVATGFPLYVEGMSPFGTQHAMHWAVTFRYGEAAADVMDDAPPASTAETGAWFVDDLPTDNGDR